MQYIIDDEKQAGERIDKYLNIIDDSLTRTFVQNLINDGKILVNGKIVKASYKIKQGDKIDVLESEVSIRDIKAQDIALDIIYEDEDILVVNKKKGMVVHPGNGNYENTLVNALMFSHKDKLSQINGCIRPGIVHRIDKDTTGLLVIAKNDKAHKILSDAFSKHDLERKYIALVHGIISKDILNISLPIGRNQKERIKMSVTKVNSKEAITKITVLERFPGSNYTLIEAKLETGRTHQIRVHMSYVGFPVVGDTVYSKTKNEFGIKGQLLHASLLEITHPITNKKIRFAKEVPEEFNNVLETLRKREEEYGKI